MAEKATPIKAPRKLTRKAKGVEPMGKIVGRLRIRKSIRLKGRLFLVSVFDEGDKSIVSLEARQAKAVMATFLAEELGKHPRTQITIGAYDDEGDGISYLLQRFD